MNKPAVTYKDVGKIRWDTQFSKSYLISIKLWGLSFRPLTSVVTTIILVSLALQLMPDWSPRWQNTFLYSLRGLVLGIHH